MNTILALSTAGLVAFASALPGMRARMQLAKAKHRSIHGHPRISQRLAKLVSFYEYSADRFFRSDRGPAEVCEQRRTGFDRLARRLRDRAPEMPSQSACCSSVPIAVGSRSNSSGEKAQIDSRG
ncbi:MAG: hypothetical protein ABJA98_11660 [Acidobacteriota bacterium]